MADQSWLVFTNKGLIGGTQFAVLGPGLYCSLYEVWVGLVVIHFLYRYIVVCRLATFILSHWKEDVQGEVELLHRQP